MFGDRANSYRDWRGNFYSGHFENYAGRQDMRNLEH